MASSRKSPDPDGAAAPDRELSLSNPKPASGRKPRKRVGRGQGSGHGRYCGRGVKGQKSRSGSHKLPAGFEGGQMPIHMRLPKLRGSTSKDALPVGPHRTSTQAVNVRELQRVFGDGDEVTLDAMVEKGLVKHLRVDVKILGDGELSKQLSVTAHRFSDSARLKIEAAGGSVVELRPQRQERRRAGSFSEGAPAPAGGEKTAEPAADGPGGEPSSQE